MDYLLKILTVVLWSAFKFIVGFSTAIVFKFNQFEILICTVGGGMLGVIVYMYLWEGILYVYHKFVPKKQKPFKINKFKRKLVVFIRKYEVWGIALLTPILLSIPIGTFLAMAIEHNKWRIKFIMFASMCIWAIILIALKLLFKIDATKVF